jgi:DNA invertase Pin-like site-specific DNA recombinase
LLVERYDDGGLSGASLERPALLRLLDAVRAGQIDIIVVYKVDRLTRSLADFAKLVELFDAHGASFVSVTQAFNTTSSMGRLTLNVLLSFAQFEREVIGERVRDKISASKQKGLWVGGPIPLGYRSEKKRLVLVDEDVVLVRRIFQLYRDLGSLRAVSGALDADGVRTRQGYRFGVGALAHLLPQGRRKGIAHEPAQRPTIDPAIAQTLLAGIGRARTWMGEIINGSAIIETIAARENLVDRHVRRLLPLACLSPTIVRAIADGSAPADLTISALTSSLPHSWAAQEQCFLVH